MFSAVSGGSELLSITTTAPSAALLFHRKQVFYALLLPGLFALMLVPANRRLRYTRVGMLAILVLLGVSVLWITGCGGGGNSTPSNPGTPTGTSTVTIKAVSSGANAITHQITVSLTIQ